MMDKGGRMIRACGTNIRPYKPKAHRLGFHELALQQQIKADDGRQGQKKTVARASSPWLIVSCTQAAGRRAQPDRSLCDR